MNQDIYLSFKDFEKVFDKIKHGTLVEILKQKNIDSRDIPIISHLFRNQTAKERVEN